MHTAQRMKYFLFFCLFLLHSTGLNVKNLWILLRSYFKSKRTPWNHATGSFWNTSCWMSLLSFSKEKSILQIHSNLISDMGEGQGAGRNDLCDFNVMWGKLEILLRYGQ